MDPNLLKNTPVDFTAAGVNSLSRNKIVCQDSERNDDMMPHIIGMTVIRQTNHLDFYVSNI